MSGLLLLAVGSACRESPAEPTVPQGPEGWEFLGLYGEPITDIELTPWGLFVGTFSGIARQRGNGSWEWLSPDYWRGHLFPRALLFVPGDPPRLLAGVMAYGDTKEDTTAAAVFASEDGGRTWYMSDGGLAEGADNQYRVYVHDLQLDPFNPDVVFMGSQLGVLRSDDGGRTWNFVLGDYYQFGGIFGPLLMDPETPGRIWYSGYTAFGYGRTGISNDGGDTWDGSMPRCPGFGPAPVPPVYDMETGLGPPGRVWVAWNMGVMLAEAGGVAEPGTWVCEPEPGQPALWAEHAVLSLERFDGALYAAPVHVPALYRLREGTVEWDTLPAPEAAAGAGLRATRAMIVDAARGRLLIGTRDGLWAFTPPGQ